MWFAVVPAHNEGASIKHVIAMLNKTRVDNILIVANGCSDNTVFAVRESFSEKPLIILEFSEPLGIDVPRAVGAIHAISYSPRGIIFVDGDMDGEISSVINNLIEGIENGLDMALTNCYPYITQRNPLAENVIKLRTKVNRKLGLFNQLGLATPSHGPHAVSGRLLNNIDPLFFAVPPLSLAAAAKNGLKIGVSASIPHDLLGSQPRSGKHGVMIAQSIIEDCRAALLYIQGEPPEKILRKNSDTGYRALRRFDILRDVLKNSVK